MKQKHYWIDCFFVQSLIWSFGSILKEPYKKEFEMWLKDTI